MLFVGTSEDGEQGCNGVQGVYKPASGTFQLMDPLPGWEVHTMDINTQGESYRSSFHVDYFSIMCQEIWLPLGRAQSSTQME